MSTINRVRAVIAEQMSCDLDDVMPSTRIEKDLMADSLDVVEISMALEEEFEIELDDSKPYVTVMDIAAEIDNILERKSEK